uniref:Meucin-25 n=1 Tax=Mesobuthus eupeus TaxID=34648 RepID=NDB52_MESEU|nr:RecName: Full=Meucin-25; AltName: Full=BeL-170; AltName: Full=Non-disulfide-bridged peptide 5.2; Short=NDBP-5.2; Flags: Precursor [Mesobuthus eupeus]ABR21050.1 venom antimicrobial peptide-5 [Mesobuthus eupeus]
MFRIEYSLVQLLLRNVTIPLLLIIQMHIMSSVKLIQIRIWIQYVTVLQMFSMKTKQ